MADDTFQHKLKCPKCRKRKVYLVVISDGFEYICKACGHTWRS